MRRFDVLILGSGLAGQSLALRLADHKRVALVTKRSLEDSSSSKAQGGIAAIFDPTDQIESHVQDTLTAGAGLCDVDATRFVVENSTEAINWLIEQGVSFTKDSTSNTGYHLTREGGHSHRRILHVDDATGAAVQKTLIAKVRAHPNITVLERHIAVDLINAAKHDLGRARCLGAYVLDIDNDKVITIGASSTILATGGAGKVYLYTTNPDTATGDGMAMAWRAGCRVANMEFIQFHPTCLFHPQARTYLITEAMRGEGGILRLPDGTRFMPDHDERAELAPRDVVARAIDFEMKKGGYDCVFLDITHRPKEFIIEHFPNIYATCMKLGIDITTQQIPVVPAVHFSCGGVVVDFKARTDLPGLYAVGETTYTGLHGANRLASNSLTECLVFSAAAAKDILATAPAEIPDNVPLWDDSRVTDADERVVISHNWDELRRFMWDYVGIVRTNKRLDRAEHRIRLLDREIDEFYANFRISSDLVELRNLVLTAQLIIRSAQHRHESRGLHYSADYPDTLPRPMPTVLMPKRDGRQPSIFG